MHYPGRNKRKNRHDCAKYKKLNRVESEIERLEAENTALDEAIADPANATNSAKLQELSIQRGENDAKLEELLEHWEELSE